MSQNLVEFLKVLTIVVTWSTLILVGRHSMLALDSSDEKEENNDPASTANAEESIDADQQEKEAA